jgi:signal transduction histidine kinase
VAITVTDDGPGVPDELRARLFEPYATGRPGGTGLGLPIAQRIAVEHGGDLTYASPPGGGARFTLTLPLAGPPELTAPAAPPAPGGEFPSGHEAG